MKSFLQYKSAILIITKQLHIVCTKCAVCLNELQFKRGFTAEDAVNSKHR